MIDLHAMIIPGNWYAARWQLYMDRFAYNAAVFMQEASLGNSHSCPGKHGSAPYVAVAICPICDKRNDCNACPLCKGCVSINDNEDDTGWELALKEAKKANG